MCIAEMNSILMVSGVCWKHLLPSLRSPDKNTRLEGRGGCVRPRKDEYTPIAWRLFFLAEAHPYACYSFAGVCCSAELVLLVLPTPPPPPAMPICVSRVASAKAQSPRPKHSYDIMFARVSLCRELSGRVETLDGATRR